MAEKAKEKIKKNMKKQDYNVEEMLEFESSMKKTVREPAIVKKKTLVMLPSLNNLKPNKSFRVSERVLPIIVNLGHKSEFL